MVDSLFPEILALIGFETSSKFQSLKKLIKNLSTKQLGKQSTIFSEFILRKRLIDMLQVFLYSDFFEKVWNGNLIFNKRCFVRKEHNELEYYNFSHSQSLSNYIFDNLFAKGSISSIDKGIIRINLEFKFVQ